MYAKDEIGTLWIGKFQHCAYDFILQMTELLSSNFASICEDKYLFAKLFTVPADLNLTIIDLQDTVCGVNLDTDKLVYELEQSISGLIEFRNAVSTVKLVF